VDLNASTNIFWVVVIGSLVIVGATLVLIVVPLIGSLEIIIRYTQETV